MNWTISQKNFDLLTQMIALAKTRPPVQGEFYYGDFNHNIRNVFDLTTKENIPNCGTSGCLAGGYLPLIDPKRFYFNKWGNFYDGQDFFDSGDLAEELGEDLSNALFYPAFQKDLDDNLINLTSDATLQEAITNVEKILAMLTVVN